MEYHNQHLPTVAGGQFGLRIVGGKKMAGGTLCAFIASITPGSPASRSPDLHEGEI